ncbi:MAG TPA: hypothetical protein VHO47_05870, partial [Candidatus Babeliales bacterium]|nr:hypothetical protein [Candidatus Babeliales bacterium]
MKQIFSIIGRKILIGLMLTSSAVFGNQSREQILDKGGFAPELVTHEESTVIEHALEHMLMRMAEHNEEPTESLLRLYQAVTENTEIKIEDLNELLPVMVECMKAEQERAA